MYVLNLGNIEPAQTATVDLIFIKRLKIVNGFYDFTIPVNYLPKLTKESKKDNKEPMFNLVVYINTQKSLLEVKHPLNCEILS